MNLRSGLVLLTCVLLVGCDRAQLQPKFELKDDEQKTIYALGANIGDGIKHLDLSDSELEILKRGLSDQVGKRPLLVEPSAMQTQLNQFFEARKVKAAQAEKVDSQKLLDEAQAQGGQKTSSGLIYQVIQEGTGDSPRANDKVQVHYEGKLRNGQVFDSTIQRQQPVTLALDQVVPCWTEALQLMKVGGKARVVCPSDLAYGDYGAPPNIPGGAALDFQIELLAIEKPVVVETPPVTTPEPVVKKKTLKETKKTAQKKAPKKAAKKSAKQQ